MNQMTTQQQEKGPIGRLMDAVFSGEGEKSIKKLLPAGVSYDRFRQGFLSVVMENPELTDCRPQELYRELVKGVGLGLSFDPGRGEAYMLMRWNGKEKRKIPQFQPGYKGLIKLAQNTGDVRRLSPREVCENDVFDCSLGTDEFLTHKPDFTQDRGDAYAYYAVVQYKDGTTDFEIMSTDQINRVREMSDGWKAFQAGKIRTTPWDTSYDAMAKKTVLRRLLNRIAWSADDQRVTDAMSHDYEPDRASVSYEKPAAAIEPPRQPEPPAYDDGANDGYDIDAGYDPISNDEQEAEPEPEPEPPQEKKPAKQTKQAAKQAPKKQDAQADADDGGPDFAVVDVDGQSYVSEKTAASWSESQIAVIDGCRATDELKAIMTGMADVVKALNEYGMTTETSRVQQAVERRLKWIERNESAEKPEPDGDSGQADGEGRPLF